MTVFQSLDVFRPHSERHQQFYCCQKAAVVPISFTGDCKAEAVFSGLTPIKCRLMFNGLLNRTLKYETVFANWPKEMLTYFGLCVPLGTSAIDQRFTLTTIQPQRPPSWAVETLASRPKVKLHGSNRPPGGLKTTSRTLMKKRKPT